MTINESIYEGEVCLKQKKIVAIKEDKILNQEL
jgi:hypothetical protein